MFLQNGPWKPSESFRAAQTKCTAYLERVAAPRKVPTESSSQICFYDPTNPGFSNMNTIDRNGWLLGSVPVSDG